MQLLSVVLTSLTVLAAEAAKGRPAGLDAAAIVEQAKQLDPQQQQEWLRRLERRLKRATALVLKPADAEKKLAEYEALFGHNPPDWQQVVKLVQQTDVAEKAAIGQLTRQYRIALYESLFGHRKEYELRHDALRRVLKAWEASGQPFSRQEVLVLWLEEAVRCNTRGSIAPLPPDPDFSKDPPWELPPDAEPAQQPADKAAGQPPPSPPQEKQSPVEAPKSQPGRQKHQLPPSEEKRTKSPDGEQVPSRPSTAEQPRKPTDSPRKPERPTTAPHMPAETPPADSASGRSDDIRELLERLGSASIAEHTAQHERASKAADGQSGATTTPDGATEPPPLEPSQKQPAGAAGVSEPAEPPVWQPLESPTGKLPEPSVREKPTPPGSDEQQRHSDAVSDVARPLRDAPAVERPIVIPGTRDEVAPAEPPGWPEPLGKPTARPSVPAMLGETNDVAAQQLTEPSIQADYHGGSIDVTVEMEAVGANDWRAGWPAKPSEPSLPIRRAGSTDEAAAPTDDSPSSGTSRSISAPPLELLASKPIALEELPRPQVSLADLNARINGYNYALRALEAELQEGGVWDSGRIRPALQRLKKLSAQRRDLEVFRELLPVDQRRLAADFEPLRPIVAQLAQHISSARQAAEQARSAAAQQASLAQEAAKELERLDALSRELAELGRE